LIKLERVFRAECASSGPINSVKALNGNQSKNANRGKTTLT